ncbi:MAG: hypothetical protein J7525_19720 [Roseofilum sp. SID3]|uniref:hypothetical protein n=1 Tax=Roseofilum sp. SID3 TaxID=2821499 RepID=UPI001B2780E3|nr:hypothetical protein [Roseofilum sp. SID3]MBP0015325.1 hypothetical protein [Roseofilum sp. SID3]
MTQEIIFQGINGEVIDSSEHGNYLVVRLTPVIIICGTFTNIWDWLDSPDISSGFISFITYLGLESEQELYLSKKNIISWLNSKEARLDFFKGNPYRKSKRSTTPFEMKIRELDATDIPDLINIAGGTSYVLS